MTLFDGYVAVGWSASARRAHGANGIRMAIFDVHGTPPHRLGTMRV